MLIDIYVIWRCGEDDFFVTLLQFPDTADQRIAMQQWGTNDYVAQAHDAEYPEGPSMSANGPSYECISIFEAPVIRFIS